MVSLFIMGAWATFSAWYGGNLGGIGWVKGSPFLFKRAALSFEKITQEQAELAIENSNNRSIELDPNEAVYILARDGSWSRKAGTLVLPRQVKGSGYYSIGTSVYYIAVVPFPKTSPNKNLYLARALNDFYAKQITEFTNNETLIVSNDQIVASSIRDLNDRSSRFPLSRGFLEHIRHSSETGIVTGKEWFEVQNYRGWHYVGDIPFYRGENGFNAFYSVTPILNVDRTPIAYVAAIVPEDVLLDGVKKGIIGQILILAIVTCVGIVLLRIFTAQIFGPLIEVVYKIRNLSQEIGSDLGQEAISNPGTKNEIAILKDSLVNLATSVQQSKEMARQLNYTSKLSALGEMAGGVAHEINNPLATIRSLSSQLEEVIDDNPIDKALIKKMSSNLVKTIDRIAKIVQGLRTFSRDGSKDPDERVIVSQLVEETLSFCRERLKHRGIELMVDDLDKNLTFQGRAVEISQVLLNLLNNASDAVESLPRKWIRISAIESQNWLEIRVTDSGSGISREVQDKLFQPFFTTKQIGIGTGMGLSISRGIAQSHRGELTLDTRNPNTCFIIRLPKDNSGSEKAA